MSSLDANIVQSNALILWDNIYRVHDLNVDSSGRIFVEQTESPKYKNREREANVKNAVSTTLMEIYKLNGQSSGADSRSQEAQRIYIWTTRCARDYFSYYPADYLATKIRKKPFFEDHAGIFKATELIFKQANLYPDADSTNSSEIVSNKLRVLYSEEDLKEALFSIKRPPVLPL